jgi:hypothetical protein
MAAKIATKELLKRLQATVAELENLKDQADSGTAGNIDMALSYLNGSVTYLATRK